MKLVSFAQLLVVPSFLLLHAEQIKAQASEHHKGNSEISFLMDRANFFYDAFQPDSALDYARKAVDLSRQTHAFLDEGYALIKCNDILIEQKNYAAVSANLPEVEKIAHVLNDTMILAIAWLQTAQIKMYQEKPDDAIKLFQKALKTKLSRVNTSYSAVAYNDMAYTYGQMGAYSLQAENLVKALKIYETIDDDAGAAMSLSNMASMYYTLGDRKKAIEYQKKSIEKRKETDVEGLAVSYCNICQMYLAEGDLKEAEHYRQLCQKFSSLSKFESRVVMGYITSGLLANAKGENKEAYQLEKKAIGILEKSHSDDVMLATRYISAAILSGIIKEDSLVTLSYYQKAMALSEKLGIRENMKSIYYYKTGFFKNRKDYHSAYENYKKYITYRDSLNSEDTKKTIAEIETRYQTARKDNEIEKLNADQKIKLLEIEKQKAVIAGDILQSQKKQNEIDLLGKSKELLDIKIKQQDEQLERNLLIAKNNEQQLQLAGQEKRIRESELKEQKQLKNFMIGGILILTLLGIVLFNRYQLKRKLQQQNAMLEIRNNIAKDLHDEVGSTLTSIKVLSEVSKKNLNTDHHKISVLLQKITDQSAQMQQSMSDIVWAVKPDNDKLENMVVRMREYISHTLEPKNIQTQFSIDDRLLNKSIGMRQRRDFFLIFKEAVNNVAKYAECNLAGVDLNDENGNIVMKITDNGVGFDTGNITSSNGVKNMKSRALALGGLCTIQSVPGTGTTVIVQIPPTS